MADSYTANLNLRMPEVGAAADNWGSIPGLNGDMQLIDKVFNPPVDATSVNVTVATGKVLTVLTGIINAAANALFLRDFTDQTKVAKFDSSLISTGTTRNFAFPDQDGTLVTTNMARSYVPVGTVFTGYYGPTPPTGFVFIDGRTIGNASSAATNRANADCEALFKHLWTICADAQCPVTPGPRTTAANDWTLNKKLQLPNHSGRGMAGRDNLSGTAAGILNGYTAPGVAGGIQSTSTGGTTLNNFNYGNVGFVQTGGYATGNATAGGGSDAGSMCGNGAPVTVSGYTGINANFNVTVNTNAFTIVQPTIAVDVVMAL